MALVVDESLLENKKKNENKDSKREDKQSKEEPKRMKIKILKEKISKVKKNQNIHIINGMIFKNLIL